VFSHSPPFLFQSRYAEQGVGPCPNIDAHRESMWQYHTSYRFPSGRVNALCRNSRGFICAAPLQSLLSRRP
jgi:hypothetical protein